jgi:hypothetical protein
MRSSDVAVNLLQNQRLKNGPRQLAVDTVLELAFVIRAVEIAFPVNVQWNFVPSGSRVTSSIVKSKNPLLHICDLYDTALCLRVLWILHHSHVQFFLAFAEGDVGCAVTRGDLKYV